MIRERRPEDDAAIAQVIREVAPAWVTTEAGVRHRREATPARERRRDWVASADGEVVAWAAGGLETEGRRDDVAGLHVFVRPAWRGRGLGASLHELVEAHVLELGAGRLLAEAADEAASRAFAERRGFRHTMTRRISQLDPRSLDAGVFARLAAELAADGFEAVPYAAFADAPELVHAVDAEASLDEPADEPIVELPFDDWLRRNWANPDQSHDASFCVVHEGRPVALAELRIDLLGSRAGNGFTGTLRAYRGRGLARLAKLAGLEWLREHEITSVVTQNDETNAAMLAVNDRLGYRPSATQLAYVRDV